MYFNKKNTLNFLTRCTKDTGWLVVFVFLNYGNDTKIDSFLY